MRITYNAPFTLTYALIATLVRILGDSFTRAFFVVSDTMSVGNPLDYFRLFSHAIGHADWAHLVSNFSLILILGPILEEKYGSKILFLLSAITALTTGILNVIFSNSGLLGASGIVFMMILLASFTNAKARVIPLTFILVMVLYVGQEVVQAFSSDKVSQFAHILGGIMGGIFGFMFALLDKDTVSSTNTNSLTPLK